MAADATPGQADEPAPDDLVETSSADTAATDTPTMDSSKTDTSKTDTPTTDSSETDRSAADAEPAGGLRHVLSSLRPRRTGSHALAALLALILGFALVTQVHQTQTSGLENLRQQDLVAVLGNVNNQSARLSREQAELTRTRDRLGSGAGPAAQTAARERLDTLGVLTGTVKARGTGIVMTITDPVRGVGAPNLLDAVQELRDAGAEAIQINGVRVVASTWFGSRDGGGIVIDGTAVTPPYVVRAIGDGHTMATAMAIPGGVTESMQQVGARVAVTQPKQVEVTALRPLSQARYARPDAAADK